MEIKLPIGSLASYTGTSQNVVSEMPVPPSADVRKTPEVKAVETDTTEPDPGILREMMKRTSELASMVSRNLKFELVDEAGLVQIQVIDSTDGRVVRKVPSDEVLKLVEYIQDKLSERVDVRA